MTAGSPSTFSPQRSMPRRRQLGRRCRRTEGRKRGSPSSTTTNQFPSSTHLITMLFVVVMACCSTRCFSFTMPRQSTQQHAFPLQTERQQQRRGSSGLPPSVSSPSMPTSLFSGATLNGSAEENVSCFGDHPKIVDDNVDDIVDDDDDESASSPMRTEAFKDVAESPAPPLNYEKYLTMQKKRVPVTIRYSTESGLKPYYLTVAKRIKDNYPDVLIERVEVSGEGNGGSETIEGETSSRTFEVVVDGKIVIRSNQRTSINGSIFVSMNEMDLAITRARKRRRPSTVYGENGLLPTGGGRGRSEGGDDVQDDFVKQRLKVLQQKAMDLQRANRNNPVRGGDNVGDGKN